VEYDLLDLGSEVQPARAVAGIWARRLPRHRLPGRLARSTAANLVDRLLPGNNRARDDSSPHTVSNRPIGDLVLEFDSQGMAYFRDLDSASPEELAKTAVVYLWQAGKEEFLAGGERKNVIRLDAVARSQFAVPTLSNLREALQRYAAENVLESTCFIFEQAWSDPTTRIFLKRGPEATMRRSLTQFLRNRLGADHDVWPEQNVNEKNPVDIQVIPRFSSNRVMLIEIKWLGWSVKETGDVTARHDQPRAQEAQYNLPTILMIRGDSPRRVWCMDTT
jgi:hypothetical protein